MLNEVKNKSKLFSLKDNVMPYPEISRHKDPVPASFIHFYKFSTCNITEERNQQMSFPRNKLNYTKLYYTRSIRCNGAYLINLFKSGYLF